MIIKLNNIHLGYLVFFHYSFNLIGIHYDFNLNDIRYLGDNYYINNKCNNIHYGSFNNDLNDINLNIY